MFIRLVTDNLIAAHRGLKTGGEVAEVWYLEAYEEDEHLLELCGGEWKGGSRDTGVGVIVLVTKFDEFSFNLFLIGFVSHHFLLGPDGRLASGLVDAPIASSSTHRWSQTQSVINKNERRNINYTITDTYTL